jgi:membrane protease YdiL (CAAX protease family)
MRGQAARAILLAALLLALARGRTGPEVMADSLPWLTSPPSATGIAAGALAGALLAAAARLYLWGLVTLRVPVMPRRDLPQGPLLLALTAIVAGPLAEEALVRGLVMGGLLLPSWGATKALLLSSLFFALAHPLPSIPWALGCGLALGSLTLAAGSIWPAVIAHAAVNAWATARLLRERRRAARTAAVPTWSQSECRAEVRR